MKAKIWIVKEKGNVLIVTDDSGETAKMAAEIAGALKGKKILIRIASEFRGNDILPAEAFFIGCEKPKPDSFAYLADVLEHINLAGRSCGIFSPCPEKAAKYLAALVHHSEASLNPEPLSAGGDVKKWVQSVIAR